MRLSRPVIVLLLAATTVSACQSSSPGGKVVNLPSPAAPSASSAPRSATPRHLVPSIKHSTALSPTARAGYLSELRDIDPRLAANPGAALADAQGGCEQLAAGALSESELIPWIQDRMSAGSLQLDEEQAHRVRDALRRHVCPASFG